MLEENKRTKPTQARSPTEIRWHFPSSVCLCDGDDDQSSDESPGKKHAKDKTKIPSIVSVPLPTAPHGQPISDVRSATDHNI